ncbi:transcriptional regulator, AraC family [Rhizobiales bacterium GAS191]|nr:transcriptional regulator, AraC family [Rhizobiales bacterium GAS191]
MDSVSRSWSTVDVPENERFGYWREAVCANFAGVTPEFEAVEHASFNGAITSSTIGDAALLEVRATSHRVVRTQSKARGTREDSISLYRELHHPAWFGFGYQDDIVTESGMLLLGDLDRPFTSRSLGRYHHLILKIPRRFIAPLLVSAFDVPVRIVSHSGGIGNLLSSYFNAFVKQLPHLRGVQADGAMQTLASLSAITYGLAPSEHEVGRHAVRAARLQAAKQFIELNLDKRGLDPACVAGALGISVRQLHLLFEPLGTSFARHVLASRLERSRLLLLQPAHGHRSVADIAFHCGFESLATFYRGFRRAYGVPPDEFRKAQADRAG